LRVVDAPEFSPGVDGRIAGMNLNDLGDDFILFTAMDVIVSPSDRFLLVPTDSDRTLILSRSNGAM
jgi:hypothetical protein